ncbi:hypothetical protein [Streptomyces microflavus]|uniref:hypothetical protein n=1 Tax=Streptomyces microflavus TaxID=1919 RepID=UPI0033A7B4EE
MVTEPPADPFLREVRSDLPVKKSKGWPRFVHPTAHMAEALAARFDKLVPGLRGALRDAFLVSRGAGAGYGVGARPVDFSPAHGLLAGPMTFRPVAGHTDDTEILRLAGQTGHTP